MVAVALLPACGDEPTGPAADASVDGGAQGCEPGTHDPGDGTCQAAGIGPEACAPGFAAVHAGCEAILPAEPCAAGTLALPGDTECHEIADCAAAPYGDAPVDEWTQYVDQSFTGTSDGSADRPWTSIQQAISAAIPGAMVVVAEGSYQEDLLVISKPVKLWGRCPALVEVVGSASAFATIDVQNDADGTEIHDLAVRGYAIGIGVSGSRNVRLEGLWVHDTLGYGVDLEAVFGETDAVLHNVLVEGAESAGIFIADCDATIERTVVRDTRPNGDGQFGRGIGMQGSPPYLMVPRLRLAQSVLERNREAGIGIIGAEVALEATVIRDTEAQESDGTLGRGVEIQGSTVTIEGCVITRNREFGVISAKNSHLLVDSSVISHGRSEQASQRRGAGMGIYQTTAEIRSSLIDSNRDFGIGILESVATVSFVLVRNTTSAADGLLGDGVVLVDADHSETSRLEGLRLETSERAGIASFGATLDLLGTRLDCNTIDLNGEIASHFNDRGRNACGCDAETTPCVVQTVALDPPSPLE